MYMCVCVYVYDKSNYFYNLKSNRKSCYEKINSESWIFKLSLSLHESDLTSLVWFNLQRVQTIHQKFIEYLERNI